MENSSGYLRDIAWQGHFDGYGQQIYSRIFVQTPDTGTFDRDSLCWEKNVAYIHTDRVQDFIMGENNLDDYPTSFVRKTHQVHEPGSLKRPLEESFLDHSLYHCAYGPENGPKSVKQRFNKSGKKRTSASKKRGCTCYFIVTQMYNDPEVSKISYKNMKHVDKDGKICHGLHDEGDRGQEFRTAPHVSSQMRDWISSRVQIGYTSLQIMSEHQDNISAQRIQPPGFSQPMSSRDINLTLKTVQNLYSKYVRSTYRLHKDDSQSVQLWIEKNANKIFFHQPQKSHTNENNDTCLVPSVLGIQTSWQRKKMIKHGGDSLVICTATFGKTKLQYQLITVLVIDEHYNGIPVAWVISLAGKVAETAGCMHALRTSVLETSPAWKANVVIIDDPQAEIGSLSMVWGEHVRVLLCLWHVKKAWLKNLCHMIEDLVTRKQLWEKLGQLLKRSYPSHYTYQQRVQESFDFLESLFTECGSTCNTFREYFRKEWMESEKMSMWLQVTNDIQHANHEVNAAIECYHANLKRKHLCSRNRLLGKRMDWLLWVLADDIEWSYEHMEQAKPLDKAENFEDQKIVPSCFVEARLIPDHDVYLPRCTDESARVHSQSKLNVKYEVLNIGSEWACCTCPRSQKGNLCKHVIKVSLLHRQGESLRKSPDVEVAAKKRKTRQKSFSLHSPPPLCASDQHNQPPSYPPVQCSSQTASCAPMVITYAFPLVEHDQNNVFISLALMAHKQMQRLQELVHADPSLTTYYLTLLQEVEERLKRVQASKIALGIPQEQSSPFRFTDANMGSGLVFCQKPCTLPKSKTLPPTKLHVVKKPKRRPRRTYPKEVSTTNM